MIEKRNSRVSGSVQGVRRLSCEVPELFVQSAAAHQNSCHHHSTKRHAKRTAQSGESNFSNYNVF